MSGANHNQSRAAAAPTDAIVVLRAFFDALAALAEGDPAFAARLSEAIRASGMFALATSAAARSRPPRRPRGAGAAVRKPAPTATEPALPDPFAALRSHGESGLRTLLAQQDLLTLRQLVRAHRLDPARISARWSNRERLMTLIVDQVRARASHGRAFERI